jgi:hypothetical protein
MCLTYIHMLVYVYVYKYACGHVKLMKVVFGSGLTLCVCVCVCVCMHDFLSFLFSQAPKELKELRGILADPCCY